MKSGRGENRRARTFYNIYIYYLIGVCHFVKKRLPNEYRFNSFNSSRNVLLLNDFEGAE